MVVGVFVFCQIEPTMWFILLNYGRRSDTWSGTKSLWIKLPLQHFWTCLNWQNGLKSALFLLCVCVCLIHSGYPKIEWIYMYVCMYMHVFSDNAASSKEFPITQLESCTSWLARHMLTTGSICGKSEFADTFKEEKGKKKHCLKKKVLFWGRSVFKSQNKPLRFLWYSNLITRQKLMSSDF